MERAVPHAPAGAAFRRDPRVDVLRGLALLTIFIDHIPGNVLGDFTLRNFGFSDAAEVFVLLAGFSSYAAYGRAFQQRGLGHGLQRIALRCLRLYVFQVGLLLFTLAIVYVWTRHFGFQPRRLAPMIYGGFRPIRSGLLLGSLPIYLDILPLYLFLLALFPPYYFLLRISMGLALACSAALWAAANLIPGMNLTNWIEGQGWFFNPFAWQLIFALGATIARIMHLRQGDLPSNRAARALCWIALGLAVIAVAPWVTWGWSEWRAVPLWIPDKTGLAPVRIANALALIYLCLTSHRFRTFCAGSLAWPVACCGKHSLEVFSVGTLLALLARLLFRTYGTPWFMQFLVNGTGLMVMLTVGVLLETGIRRYFHASGAALPISARK
jgi:hypothetical protein